MMIMVFVYGTLRKGEVNHRFLENKACIAEQSWTTGLLYDTGCGYPAMKRSPHSRIYGELYSITVDDLKRLDQLEDYKEGGSNNLYDRIEQTVFTDKGAFIAYVYVANNENLLKRIIKNGDWKEHVLLTKANDSLLYFAYGSCMDDKRFREHGVAHYFDNMLGTGVLKNYTLRFTRRSADDGLGRSDIVEEGGRVEGKVYKIPVKVLKDYLYGREGAPNAYRPAFVTIELNGEKVQALTFVVNDKKPEMAPPDWYEEEIIRGAKGFLSADYIAKIQNHIDFLKN